jgi:hypothetical protein
VTYTGTSTRPYPYSLNLGDDVPIYQFGPLPRGDWDITWSAQGSLPDGACGLFRQRTGQIVDQYVPLRELPRTVENQTFDGDVLVLQCFGHSDGDTITGFTITMTQRTQSSLQVTFAQ